MPVNCKECNREFMNDIALTGHMKAHAKGTANLNTPVQSPKKALTDTEKAIQDLRESRNRRMLSAMQDNEMLAIQLENKRMREELIGNSPTGTAKNPVNQPDNFEQLFNQLSKLDTWKRSIKDEILEDLDNSPEEEKEGTEQLFLKFITNKLMSGEIPLGATGTFGSGQQPIEPVSPAQNKGVISVKLDLKEIIKEIPDEVKIRVKSGAYTKEQIIQYAVQSGLPIEKAEELYNLLKGV